MFWKERLANAQKKFKQVKLLGKGTLQPAELLASCAVCFRFPPFVRSPMLEWDIGGTDVFDSFMLF